MRAFSSPSDTARINRAFPTELPLRPQQVHVSQARSQPARKAARPHAGQYLPGPATLPPRVQRARGGGLNCCALLGIVGGGLLLLGAIGIGVGFGVLHGRGHDGGSSNTNGNGSPASTGGGASPSPTPTGGVTGGASGAALANANLAAITLSGCSSDDYSGQFSIGGQAFMLTIDSGSSTTAVAGEGCGNCDVSPRYSPGGNVQTTGGTAESEFGDGSGWSGKIYADTIVGGTTANNATAPVTMDIVSIQSQSQFFHAATCSAQGSSSASDSQGILGLGPQDLELPGTDDFVSKLALVSGLPNAYAFMACDSNSKGSGFITFGGYHPDLVTQDPQFVPMASIQHSFPYYGVNIDSVALGSASVASQLGPGLVDTGTSQLYLQTSAYKSFVSALSGNSAFANVFPSMLEDFNQCYQPNGGLTRAQVDSQLPTLSISVDNGSGTPVKLALPASKSWLMPMAQDPSSTSAELYCFGVGDGGAQGPNIIGNTIMRGVMVVFDVGNQQVGFAPSQGCPLTLS